MVRRVEVGHWHARAIPSFRACMLLPGKALGVEGSADTPRASLNRASPLNLGPLTLLATAHSASQQDQPLAAHHVGDLEVTRSRGAHRRWCRSRHLCKRQAQLCPQRLGASTSSTRGGESSTHGTLWRRCSSIHASLLGNERVLDALPRPYRQGVQAAHANGPAWRHSCTRSRHSREVRCLH